MPSPAARPLQPSDLVGLIESGRPLLGVIQAIKGSRAEVRVGADSKLLQRPLRQLDLIAAGPDPLAPARSPSQAPWRLEPGLLAASRPRERDFAAAWLLLQDASEAIPLSGFSDLVSGGDAAVSRACCWMWLHGPQTLFRWRQGLVEPRQLTDLRQLRRDRHLQNLQEQRQRLWHQALRQRQPIVPAALAPAHAEELQLLRRWACGDVECPLPASLRKGLQASHCDAEPGAIRHLLVDLGQWEPHHLPALEHADWRLGFAPELEAEAQRLADLEDGEWPGDASRLDLSHLHTVTIDDDDTRDIDDGLALERCGGGVRLWVHVADPGRLIEADSPLDREARRRGSSLYLSRGTLPMFPAVLAEDIFSLRQGKRCPAWSLWVDLDEEGGIAQHGLTRSWVRPRYRLSYSDADELLELAPPQEDLPAIGDLLNRRRRWRLAHGALLLDQAEGRIRCRDGRAELTVTEPSSSRLLVAEAMILAGSVIASVGQLHQLALPYRSQPPAELPSSQELAILDPGPVRHAAVKRCLSRGHMGCQPAPHFSLGLPAYVQATSPIRRYGDLLTQRQLAAWQAGLPPLTEAELQALLNELEGPLREGLSLSRDDQRHWRQVWFAQEKRPEWRGCFLRWLRPQDQLGLVHLDDLAMELPVECPAASAPGDALLVRVHQVDPLRDLLRLHAVA